MGDYWSRFSLLSVICPFENGQFSFYSILGTIQMQITTQKCSLPKEKQMGWAQYVPIPFINL